MSVNKRELILDRMFEILESFKGPPTLLNDRLVTTARNRGKLANDELPAGFLLDGDESTTLAGDRRGRVKMSPVMVTMRPQVFVVLKLQSPKNETVGPLLNKYRGMFIHGFATDTALLSLIGDNGDISFDGMITDMKTGMPMEGEAQLNFAIRCFLNPYS
jgi:hypothetical protein